MLSVFAYGFLRLTGRLLTQGLTVGLTPTLNLFPILRFLPKYRKTLNIFNEVCQKTLDDVSFAMDVALASDEDNFVKSFFKADGPNYSRVEVQFVIRDLMVGGSETSAIQVSILEQVFPCCRLEIQINNGAN